MRQVSVTALALLVCGSMPLSAQTAAEDSAARFLEVLLAAANPDSDRMRIRIGQAAPQLASMLGQSISTQVLGSLSGATGGITIFWSDAPEALSDSITAVFAQRSWLLREPPVGMFASQDKPQPRVLCDGDSVAVTIRISEAGDHVAVHQIFNANQLCNPAESLVGPLLNSDVPSIPPLRNARTVGEKHGARAWEWYWGVDLDTGLALAEVQRHYVESLRAEGWDVGDPVTTGVFTAAPVSAAGPRGATWSGVLIVSAGPQPNRIAVRMTLDAPED